MKVLIIKTGHTETFDTEVAYQEIVSLGDVLRTTVLLHVFKNDSVDWLTSKEAMPLLANIQCISLTDSFEAVLNQQYDLVINLEKSQATLERLPLLSAENFIGFSFENSDIIFHAKNFKDSFSKWISDPSNKMASWSEKLYLMLGRKWQGEQYVFHHEKNSIVSNERIKIGLNWKVGQKWPGKSWPLENWQGLGAMLSSDFDISWQEGFNDLNLYTKWLSSCDFVVTHDSLGLHICIALKKPFLALFGPTSSREIELYELGKSISTQELTVNGTADIINQLVKR